MFFELEPVFNNVGFSIKVDYEIDFSNAELSGVLPFRKPVRVSGVIRNNAGVVSTDITAAFDMEIPCDRCAVEIKRHLEIPVEHVLVTELNDNTNDELILLDSLRFNLDELVSDDIFLSLPTKFLCREDCKGICPHCGQNLNISPCSCKKPVDPRLEALTQLLDKEG